mmetsp:Transcript_43960/g.70279  ORF Transcript_43960/g.70279 Transcript_43960/m.70279 type:complete len:234 (+) Transcript_43960:70-771(+)|eukprot:CAMPEP_0169183704 /NCGR_PEP_ID=MMETSP1016-20121227/813_1 /TAXON_ID=342587 /ORGANISM="Karlodinium micrum, Strain CCMP2283" /LENGTH=233 /DNA_ID=CAMNT_0009259175 /DNA_START=47 /DNA_END=748 /DNA_ORIENTATION=-
MAIDSDEKTDAEDGLKKRKTESYGAGPDYWDKRYRKDPSPFEWLRGFHELKDLIHEVTNGNPKANILHTGCGNSLLPEEMYEHGYHSIVNIDNSSVAIEQMASRNQHRIDMQWLVMDCVDLKFEDGSFDLVIDKSVIDAMACGDQASLVIASYMTEVQRILRPGGVFLCITYGSPDTRLEHFQHRHLEFNVLQREIRSDGESSKHWAYICRKADVVGSAPSLWPEVKKELSFY